MHSVRPIRTEADYQAALARAEAIFQAQPGEPEFDELEVLTTLIEAYEMQQYPIPPPDACNNSISPHAVWVFHGAGGRFTSGVFVTQAQAEAFISQRRLTGVLTKYPLGVSAYDWAIAKGFFKPTKPAHYEAGFIQRFTTASQEHHHYDPDEIG